MPLTEYRCQKRQTQGQALQAQRRVWPVSAVNPKGGRYWRMDYRFAEKRKTLSIGIYPEVSLQAARKARAAARETLSAGYDPAEVKRANKR